MRVVQVVSTDCVVSPSLVMCPQPSGWHVDLIYPIVPVLMKCVTLRGVTEDCEICGIGNFIMSDPDFFYNFHFICYKYNVWYLLYTPATFNLKAQPDVFQTAWKTIWFLSKKKLTRRPPCPPCPSGPTEKQPVLGPPGKKVELPKSVLWIRIRMDPHSFFLLDLDPHSICGSGSRRYKFDGKNTKNARKLVIIVIVLNKIT